ncbi:unnamed protein product [Adineta ricciae]|uniref:Serine-threonine/tyrosine-protein kinase catalytic domain-containing protein n=1 Tax=Adineta ricciae TaxID=249248 RepID=A0A816H1J2_ADIRI|nr:unnamed protein product [Adineta ricciae]
MTANLVGRPNFLNTIAYDATNVLVKLTNYGISCLANVTATASEVMQSKDYLEKSAVWAYIVVIVLAWEIYSKGSKPMIHQVGTYSDDNDRRMLAGERLVRPVAHFQVQWTIFSECTKHNSIQGSTFVQVREKIRRF